MQRISAEGYRSLRDAENLESQRDAENLSEGYRGGLREAEDESFFFTLYTWPGGVAQPLPQHNLSADYSTDLLSFSH